MTDWFVGSKVSGYHGGIFRDPVVGHVEALGADWVVVRDDRGKAWVADHVEWRSWLENVPECGDA